MVNIGPAKKRLKSRKGNHFRKQRKVIPWRRLLIGALWGTMALGSLTMIVAVAYYAAQMLFASDYFKVEQIRVEDNRRISREEILALSDIHPGTNIFELDLGRIGTRIEENPWIASAKVRRMFPNQLVIRVAERTPRALVCLDYLYYLDASGQIFKRLERGDRLDFPVISGIDRQALLARNEATMRHLDTILGVLESLDRRKVFGVGDVSELSIDDTGSITLYTCNGGVPIRMGQNDFDSKLNRFEKIFPQIKTRLSFIDYIDLNVTRRVIVKLDAGNVRGKG
jgi:cell division protein FtsQ